MEEIKDYKNVVIEQESINFNAETNTFYITSEQLKCFIGDKVQLTNEDNVPNRSLEDFIDELQSSGLLSVYRAEKDEKNDIRFSGITANYFYHFILTSEIKNNKTRYNIAILDVITGKSQIVQVNYANRSKRLKLVFSSYGIGVIFHGELNTHSGYRYFNDDWGMSERLFDNITTRLNDFFEQDIQKNGDIPYEFNKNIIDTIYQVNEAEKKIEEDQANAGAGLRYDSVKIINKEDIDNDLTYLLFGLTEKSSTFNSVHAKTYVEGTNVSLDINTGKLSGRIEEINDENEYCEITISIRDQFEFKNLFTEGEIKLKPNLTQYRVRRNVINSLRNRTVKSTYMYDTFTDFTTKPLSEFSEQMQEFIDDPSVMRSDSPEAQKNAVKIGLQSNDIELVLGPPGTGKTTVIVAWIKYLVKHKQRVLVSSKNNAAVDNVLERLPKDFIDEDGNKQDLSIIRIGSNENKIAPSCRGFLAKNRLADSQERIKKSTQNAIELINECKDKAPALIQKIDNDIEQKKDIAICQQQIEIIKNSPEYQEANKKIEDTKQLLDKYLKQKEELVGLSTYVSEYKKLNFFSKLKEGLLGFIILKYEARKSKSIDKSIADTKSTLSNLESKFNEYNGELVNYQNFIDKVLIKKLLLKQEDIEPFAKLNTDYSLLQLTECDTNTLESFKDYLIKTDFGKYIDIIKDWQEQTQTTGNRILTDILAEDSNVVGATCIGINSNKQFANLNFDITILDESGQIQIQDAIVPLTRSKKNILLGDHNQIPPQANEDVVKLCNGEVEEKMLLKNSFFEYLYNNMKGKTQNVVDLDSQFRMPETLANLVGWKFYEGNYKSPLASKDAERGVVIPGTEKPLIVIDTSKAEDRFEFYTEGSRCNYYEAKVIAKLLSKVFSNPECLIKTKDNGERVNIMPYELVGIIAPYSKQIQTIRDAVKKEKIECGETKISPYVNDMVATLDSFQGQERPLIIFDFTRSSNAPADESRVGFLRELRRLNVAFTRSTKQLVIVGDMDYLTSCEYVDTKSNDKYNSEKEFSDFIRRTLEDAKTKGHVYSAEEIING